MHKMISRRKIKQQLRQTRTRRTRLRSPLSRKGPKERPPLSVQVSYTKVTAIFLGTTFVVEGKFEYIKQIGHGAYGVVCSAYDLQSKVKVAIKKVPKAFEDLIDAKRIVREIKLLSKHQKRLMNP